MERINFPLAEFVKVLCTNPVLITARAVPTKRASVQCVGKRFWIPRTTNKRLSRCIDEVSGFLYHFAFCFKFSRCIVVVQVTKQHVLRQIKFKPGKLIGIHSLLSRSSK